MGEARGEKTFYPKTAERTRNVRLHGRFGVRGGRSASVFALEAGKNENPNVLQKNDGKNSEKH